ncbi:filamentous hemagglutinin N-terminal domain-containing protein [Vibrio penaeicida]|uniref:Filamentous haemagglutinin FhaB/tRNA nuclease CdiA-like TPS domain-containing protein n=2 Tax=Vibrio penaeicida TaxID=104609 RepID=A0AAV5NU95_9VIBR|nr:filamentous hemagglutinin N-terminal domain-containing protein [Vibrio penaeicida]GLQ74000.1 hypothetical protein GCM10007932_33600 [Vibrio penaeicida]
MKKITKSVEFKRRGISYKVAACLASVILLFPTGLTSAGEGYVPADTVIGVKQGSVRPEKTSDGARVNYIYPETKENVTFSRTQFSHFINRFNTLYINNNPKINSKLIEPSNLTIIENLSSQPMVIGNIEVLGKRSDLLFVSPSGIVCDSCNFKNAGRVTLAAGSLSNNHQEITTKNGTITIQGNGLTTSDADIIDLVSERFVQYAPIDTFVKVKKLSGGGYTLDSNGSHVAAQTHLRINVGDYIVDYETLESTWNGGSKNNTLTIDRNINAGSLYIHAPGDITLASSALPILNTKADISIVGSHKDKSVIPFGSIKLTSYGAITLLDSTIVSPSKVALNSSNLYISPSSSDSFQKASIDADSVSFAVKDNIYNGGLITAGDVRLSAKNFYNAGKPDGDDFNWKAGGEIFASRDIFIQADLSLVNVNRGMLVGNNVYLSSGLEIKNGQSEPWYCLPQQYQAYGAGLHIPSDKVDLGIGAGTIMSRKVQACPVGSRKYWSTTEREAYIFGFNIALKSPKVINSNPRLDLFKDINEYNNRGARNTNSDPADDLTTIENSHEVSISAENTLQIEASTSLQNGSGSLEVLNGDFALTTPLFENHRYYIAGRTHNTSNQNVQWLAANSPVARVLVGHNLDIKGNKISNLAGNFEVLGGMQGRLTAFENFGLTLRKKVIGTRIYHHSRTYCSKRVWRWCVRRSTHRWTTSSQYLVSLENTDQVPAFFYLGSGVFDVTGVATPERNEEGTITSGTITYGNF